VELSFVLFDLESTIGSACSEIVAVARIGRDAVRLFLDTASIVQQLQTKPERELNNGAVGNNYRIRLSYIHSLE